MSKLVNLDTMKTRRSHIFYPLLILVLFIIQANYPLYAENCETKQSVTIQGIIIDEYNEPLIGVNVREKQTTNGTISDFDGRFITSRCQW